MTNSVAALLPVRVWWGFRRPELSGDQFVSQLGSLFMPATIYVPGTQLGVLSAYMPTVLPQQGAPGVPNEVALVFYKSVDAYNQAMTSLEGRSYQLLHSAIFSIPPSSTNGFPPQLSAELKFDQPYFLYADASDWQKCTVTNLVGTRKSGVSEDSFQAALLSACTELQSESHDGSTVIVRASASCLTAWELSSGASAGAAIARFQALVDTVQLSHDNKVVVPGDLNGAANWLTVQPGQFLNFQFGQ